MENKKQTLPFVLEAIGESPKQPNVCRDEGFQFHQFIWVVKGAGKFEVAGDIHYLGEGEGMFMRRDVPQYYWADAEVFHTRFVTFSGCDSLVDYSIGNKPYQLFKVPDSLCNIEYGMLQKTAKSNSTPYKISAAGYAFVTDFFEKITEKVDDVTAKAQKYMEENCHKQLSLEDIAIYLEMDKYALCRYFKMHNNKTVMDELLSIRINKAKRLLRYTSEKVETIGVMCGFESHSYFSLRFRERCGCTPSRYRENRM